MRWRLFEENVQAEQVARQQHHVQSGNHDDEQSKELPPSPQMVYIGRRIDHARKRNRVDCDQEQETDAVQLKPGPVKLKLQPGPDAGY